MVGHRKMTLLGRVRDAIRTKQNCMPREQSDTGCIGRFILFRDRLRPKDLGAEDIEEYLRHLVIERTLATSTQIQALNALVFCARTCSAKTLRGPEDRSEGCLELPGGASTAWVRQRQTTPC